MLNSTVAKKYSKKLKSIVREVDKYVIGQSKITETIIKCMICDGHCLLEGVPGVAKTMLALILSKTIEGAVFKRIQFTPDLLPSDILGTVIYREEISDFEVYKGPIFANIVLADEINRTPPKVQSAMLEAMQERQVTIGKQTYPLPKPFFVIATQNPVETRGVYPLPEAQVDRFLFKIIVTYPSKEHEKMVIDHNLEVKRLEEFDIPKLITLNEITELQKLVKDVHSSREIKEYIVHIVNATRHLSELGLEEERYIKWGASPRASIFLNLAAKANALFEGRNFVMPEDVRKVAYDVLRHRIILNYEGVALGIRVEDIITKILKSVKVE